MSGVSISTSSATQTLVLPTQSQSVTYTLSGTLSGNGTLTAAYAFNTLSSSVEKTVDANPTIVHDGNNYQAVLSSTGNTWLDRNLGATQVATGVTDFKAYGGLFQWGRAPDDHQDITWSSATLGNPDHGTINSNADVPTGDDRSDFITEDTTPFDWRLTPNDALWTGTTATNNPCPSGYRLPTATEWEDERQSFSPSDSSGAYSSVLKLTVVGYRYRLNGNLLGAGTTGNYWSRSVNGSQARSLYLSGSDTRIEDNDRANGYSVRCIKD